jgi:hypothetical protein
MKYSILFTFLAFAFGKSYEDPVARHDANQCAGYLTQLCPRYSEALKQYLERGCQGSFKQFVQLLDIPIPNTLDPSTNPKGGQKKQKHRQ